MNNSVATELASVLIAFHLQDATMDIISVLPQEPFNVDPVYRTASVTAKTIADRRMPPEVTESDSTDCRRFPTQSQSGAFQTTQSRSDRLRDTPESVGKRHCLAQFYPAFRFRNRPASSRTRERRGLAGDKFWNRHPKVAPA